MSVANAVAIGGSIYGAYKSNKNSKKASKSADKATDASERAAAEQLKFDKSVYADEKKNFAGEKKIRDKELAYSRKRRAIQDKFSDKINNRWESIYGPLAENLGKFYGSLNANTFATAGLNELAKTFSESRVNVMRTLAQRGLGGGALEASLLAEGAIDNAEAKALIRRDAPFQVAKEKAGFMQSLAPPLNTVTPNVPSAPSVPTGSNVSNAIANQGAAISAGYMNQANMQNQNASSLMQSSFSLLNSGISNIINKPKIVNPGTLWRNPDTGVYQ